jgi:hypothetical protein
MELYETAPAGTRTGAEAEDDAEAGGKSLHKAPAGSDGRVQESETHLGGLRPGRRTWRGEAEEVEVG